jgi:adenine deaminase
MKNVMRKLTIVLAGISLAAAAFAQDCELVINNGRVMDSQTMNDAVANVGVKDGKIAVITKDAITGKEAIDATGEQHHAQTHLPGL